MACRSSEIWRSDPLSNGSLLTYSVWENIRSDYNNIIQKHIKQKVNIHLSLGKHVLVAYINYSS